MTELNAPDESIQPSLVRTDVQVATRRRPRGTGSLYRQRSSANWSIQYYRNGKVYRQTTGTTNRRKAERMLAKKLAEIATHTFIEPRAERILVEELAQDMLRDYEINGRKSLDDAKTRWEKHLQPVFGQLRAANVNNDDLAGYVSGRQTERASNATINRELAVLKRSFSLGVKVRKVFAAPSFPRLEERNIRKGFLEDTQYQALAKACSGVGLWMRALFEVGYNFGWRIGELMGLRVRQIDLISRTIRLDPGTTKNDEGRTIVMTGLVYALLQTMPCRQAAGRLRIHAQRWQAGPRLPRCMGEGVQASWRACSTFSRSAPHSRPQHGASRHT